MSRLRVVFPKPGFFLVDTVVQVLVDGQFVYQGSFKAGFVAELPVEPGLHRVETRIQISPFERTREWSAEVVAGEVTPLEVSYSRLWGNFSKKATSTRGPA